MLNAIIVGVVGFFVFSVVFLAVCACIAAGKTSYRVEPPYGEFIQREAATLVRKV